MMNKGTLSALAIGVALSALFFWMIRAGDPQQMSVAGMALASPETQAPKVDVDKIGVHSVIGEGGHSHDGKISAEGWEAEQRAHAAAEREIFQRPGGLYTLADIERNGSLSPAKKYERIHARHDLKTKKGDRICPISETRSNDAFGWWVGGKRYTFCCTPCVEEFVMQAKRAPGDVKRPEEYVKR